MMKLKATKHRYFCNERNGNISDKDGENFGLYEFDSWGEYSNVLKKYPQCLDMNHMFRFDILINKETNEYELMMFYILQRKGVYRPVKVKKIEEKDMQEIEEHLRKHFKYLMNQWNEFLIDLLGSDE